METEHMLENSRAKLEKKHLDMIVANNLKVAGAGFGSGHQCRHDDYGRCGDFTRKDDKGGDSRTYHQPDFKGTRETKIGKQNMISVP